jgi:cytochrome d ubiquinol oxidase subunit II
LAAWLATIEGRGWLQAVRSIGGFRFLAEGIRAVVRHGGGDGHRVSTYRRIDPLPFAMIGVFFLAAFLSLAVKFWPYLIPYSITVANAAAPAASVRFLFYGAVVVLPAIAIYTGVYWGFRGKFREGRFDEQSTASEVAHEKAHRVRGGEPQTDSR